MSNSEKKITEKTPKNQREFVSQNYVIEYPQISKRLP